jgi:membrane protein
MMKCSRANGSPLAPFKAVLFDIDGTLVDSNEFHVLAWDEAFRSNNRSVPRHLLRQQIGKGADNLIPSLFTDMTEAEQKELSNAHGEIFKSRYLEQVRAFPFAGALVHALHAEAKKVLLASSSGKKEVEHYARLLGIESALTGTVSFDDVDRTKPAGDLFAVALRRAGVAAQDAVAVGDTPYDVEAASKCGIRTIAVRSGGFTDQELEGMGPLALVMDVGALFEHMRETGNS